jgi:hypothetical protein
VGKHAIVCGRFAAGKDENTETVAFCAAHGRPADADRRGRGGAQRGDQQAYWRCVAVCLLVYVLPFAGTGLELEVLFDAKLSGGRLDWKDVIPRIEEQGPLLVIARTDKGCVSQPPSSTS